MMHAMPRRLLNGAVVTLDRTLGVLTPLHVLNDVARGLQLRMPLRLHIQQLLQPLVNHLAEQTQKNYEETQV
jgi:uncharacterized membrane protein YcfT